MTLSVLTGLDRALAHVIHVMKEHYKPKDLLIASLRGKEKHFHFHIIPLWPDEERQWREKSRHESGHLFEFLGDQEKSNHERNVLERIQKGWSEEDQRNFHIRELADDVEALNKIVKGSEANFGC